VNPLKVFLLAGVACCYSGVCFAESRISSLTINFFFSTEDNVMVYSDSGFDKFGDFQNCASDSGSTLAYLTLDHPKFDELYAMLITAYVTNKSLVLWPKNTGDPAVDCRGSGSLYAGPVIHGITLN